MSSAERVRRLLAASLLGAAFAAGAGAQGAAPVEALTPALIASAVKAVAADPNLGGVHTERRLRLKLDDDEPSKPTPRPRWWEWLGELGRWVATGGRWLVFLCGAAAVGLAIVYATRWIKAQAEAGRRVALALPTHVHDLDIRPDSLPPDIAAAARALWLAGEQRAALSLLYRGTLSRLVHRHALPIRAASTEGECVRLAARHLPASAAAFVERLVSAWLLAVYGARMPPDEQVAALCGEFAAHWPAERPA